MLHYVTYLLSVPMVHQVVCGVPSTHKIMKNITSSSDKKQMEMSSTIWRKVLILVFAFCFSMQVLDVLAKYFREQATVVSRVERLDLATLPVVSLCPGFKDEGGGDYYDQIYELWGILEENQEKQSLTESDLLNWWHNATYDIEDVLISIRKPGLWKTVNETIVQGTGNYKELNASINEVSTNYGRCYSIYFYTPLKNVEEYYTFRFNLSYHDELQIFVHERYAEVGLLWSFWPVEPHSFTMKNKGHVISVVQENQYKPITHEYVSCINDKGGKHSYPKCVRDWARQAFKDMFTNNNRSACWHPTGLYLSEGWHIPACLSRDDERFSRYNAYNTIIEQMRHQNVTKCPRKCIQTDWKVTNRQEPLAGVKEGEAMLYLSHTMRSEHFEEILIYDASNVLATVGGSMGLFLGVSCLSVFSFCYIKAKAYFKKH